MGSEDFYPEERPVHEVAVDGFWMDEHPVTAAEFRRFVRETGYVTVAERPLDPDAVPRCRPRPARARLARLPQVGRARRPERLPQLVGVRARRLLAPAGREGHDDQRTRPPPGRARRSRGRRGVRSVGRQGAADRGRVGARRARRPGRRDVRLGRRALPGRQGDGELLAGRVPVAEPEARRARGHLASRQLPAERVRPLRHDGQRLGVDLRLVRPTAPGRGREPVLRPEQPAGDLTRAELQPRSARRAHPASRDQGRLAPVRARTTACATGRPRGSRR